MNILNIDSTSRRLFITISRNGEVVSSASRESERRYMEMIISDIDSTLKKAGLKIREIEAIGINRGPGDFTGTRIGISVAKTLGWVLDIPVYGINSLDVLAHSISYINRASLAKAASSGKKPFLVPCLDVKRGELYFSIYEIKGDINGNSDPDSIAGFILDGRKYGIYRRADMELADAVGFPQVLYGKLEGAGSQGDGITIIGGNSTVEYLEILSGLTDKDPELMLDRKNVFPHPGSLDACVRQAIKNGVPGQRVDPVYVRDFMPFGRQDIHIRK